jgi:hypothetical protein
MLSDEPRRVTFGHDQCATKLPEGAYDGEVVITPHALGSNGMAKSWTTVRIVDGPYDGTVVAIWGTNGEQET